MLKLFNELKRRNVIKTMGVYGAAAILTTTTAASIFPFLLLPDWTVRFVIVLAILGLPITFLLSWTYDLKRETVVDNKFSSENVPTKQKSKKILLPLTGILTIIGGAFWIWYGIGDITTGSDLDLQMGIKKSIAVLDFENLTGVNEVNFKCSAISEYIRTGLHKLGKLDVKARSANIKDLYLDFIIEGALLSEKDNTLINIRLVNAKSESILWDEKYKAKDRQIVAVRDTIIYNLLKVLGINFSENELVSNKSEYGNEENFTLLGEGIYHFDKKDYAAAIKAFDSVLTKDPGNIVALYNKANSFYKKNKFPDALDIYTRILDPSTKSSRIDWNWKLPNNGKINRTLCTQMELIKEDLAIMLSREEKLCRLIGFNPALQKIIWEIPFDDVLVDAPLIINNIIFLTSNRVAQKDKGTPTLYAYDINGGEIFTKAFEQDNDNQTVFIKIREEYSNISHDASKILVSFNKIKSEGNNENYMEWSLIDTKTAKTLWTSQKIKLSFRGYNDFMLINKGNAELLLLIFEQDLIALDNKTGEEMWRKHFPGSQIGKSATQKILIWNHTEKYLAIWDPILRREIDKYSHQSYYTLPKERNLQEFWERQNMDVLLANFINGDLVAINSDGGFFNLNRVRWTQEIGVAKRIWFKNNIFNRLFCLTEDDTLFTLNLDSGEIINSFATKRHDYNVYDDGSQNAMILNNEEFLIGVDPKNGDQLWKIRTNKIDKIELVENSVITVTPIFEDSLLLINTYNRDNGNLIWHEEIYIPSSLSTWPVVAPMCVNKTCDYCCCFTTYLYQYSDRSILLNLHDEIIKINAIQGKGNVIQQNEIQLQIARTYEKNRQLDSAIEEYNKLTEQDQMNQDAYWEIANIYQDKKQDNKAAQKLIMYYELINPESPEGINTINKLKNLNVLKWEKDIYWEGFTKTDMYLDKERIFLFLDNKIKTYRIDSGAEIWISTIGDKNVSMIISDVTNNQYIFYIKKQAPDVHNFYKADRLSGKTTDLEAIKKATKYFLGGMNKKNAKITLDVPLGISGENDILWMGINNNRIFIQSIIENKMSISAYDINDGDLLWEIFRDVSGFYISYDLKPIFYNGNLILPLDFSIEYLDDNGNVEEIYIDENIDNIFLFNETSIYNNIMTFIIEDIDYHYVIVDLDSFIKIAGGPIDIENPKLGYINHNMFVDVSSSDSVKAYKLDLDMINDAAPLWSNYYNSSLNVLEIINNDLYLFDKENNNIHIINTQKGEEIKSRPLLWQGKNVDISNNYFIVQSANKLYLTQFK